MNKKPNPIIIIPIAILKIAEASFPLDLILIQIPPTTTARVMIKKHLMTETKRQEFQNPAVYGQSFA